MSQTTTNQPSKPGRGTLRTLGLVGLVVVAIVAAGFAGYKLIPAQTSTITQQRLVTATQSFYTTQTVTNNPSTATTVVTQSSTTTVVSTLTNPYGNGFGYPPEEIYQSPYQNCGNYCPPPSSAYQNNYYACNLSSYPVISNENVTCYGYLYQDPDGCVELVVPVTNPYYFESPVYQIYSLHNLPSSAPAAGSWVTVNGQLYYGDNASPSAASCPLNFINVTSISQ